ncbi:MAG: bifunctional lysylphosphatidylglycerol flippase/synthetase MprF, partial [Gammaproteobacteria bacterium]|nr:bifunctional lysylphosphatidylglycerol flippase/synthetase MprF [Gammaproteobacteria bacterium]
MLPEKATGTEGATLDVTAAWRRWLAPAVSLLVFALVIVVLHHALAQHHLRDIVAQLRTISAGALLAAATLTAVSYLLLTLYDVFALRYVARPLPYPRTALTSFIAYAFGHNLSLAAFTGAAVRYRVYSTQGLTAVDVATISSFCALTTALGLSTLGGIAALGAVPGTTALHLGHVWSRLFGVLLLGLVAGYAAWAALARRPLLIGSWEIRPPGARLAGAQLAVGVADLSVSAAVLWVLLPASLGVSLPTFAGVYAIAVVAGIVSQVPGGLGVFEALLLLALPQVPAPELLGALLAWRGLYYFAPLALAALVLLAHELYMQRSRLAHIRRAASGWITPLLLPIAPQLIGVLVFVAGAVLLVSGATPALDGRIHAIRHIVPLPLLELSHLAGSVIGVGLLALARGLFRRLRAAWHLTLWLLIAGIAASLLKGLDIEEAAFLALVLLVLLLSAAGFHRPASLMSQRYTPGWLASIGIIVVLSVWLGLLANRHVPYSNDLWWTFALRGDAPRMLRASLAVIVLLSGFVAAHLLRPAPAARYAPVGADDARIGRALARADASLANAVRTGDKRVLFHDDGDAFLMYQVSGHSWIALGDPVGSASQRQDLVWAFRELVDLRGGRTVFYQVGPANLPLYVDLGLSLAKLGEEARVRVTDFNLEGSARAGLRQARRRAERSGASFAVAPPGDERLLPQLRAISDAWLDDKATAEKRFSVGAFSEAYLRQFAIATVCLEGQVVAFANLWPTGTHEELSIDLMRFGRDAPGGAMDYLLIELLLWAREQGYRWFNLGMAPLSGLESRALAPLWHRMGGFLYRHGESFYNFDGLRRYKEKFAPVWEPRYLASPGGLQLPRALYDVSVLISGGLKELV